MITSCMKRSFIKLGKKVDVLTYDSINPLLKARILKEQKLIYEKRA